jgi:hypothetical protein
MAGEATEAATSAQAQVEFMQKQAKGKPAPGSPAR